MTPTVADLNVECLPALLDFSERDVGERLETKVCPIVGAQRAFFHVC